MNASVISAVYEFPQNDSEAFYDLCLMEILNLADCGGKKDTLQYERNSM